MKATCPCGATLEIPEVVIESGPDYRRTLKILRAAHALLAAWLKEHSAHHRPTEEKGR